MASNSCLIAKMDEQRWICQIREMLEEEQPEDADEDIQASIFSVPIPLRATNPDSYTPQIVALGPYHRNHPQLFEMERNKLLLAKKTHQHLLQGVKFQHLVDQLKLLDSRIRASYQTTHLGFSKEMMSWMMAIDAAFLLHFLQIMHTTKLPDSAIIRDVVMLENQIPLLVLRKAIEIEIHPLEAVEDSLQCMLVGLCKDLTPFGIAEELVRRIPTSECAHLLDFLYRIVAPKLELSVQEEEAIEECKLDNNERSSRLVELVLRFKKVGAWLLNKLLLSRPMKVVLALPLIVFCHLPALAILKDPIENLFSENINHEQTLEIEPPRVPSDRYNAIPLVEEITIPSVCELSKSRIIFVPMKGGISGITFDAKTNEFRLPIVSLDVNSEVVLRNLVAYEATSSSRPLLLARYTELMNGIIDSEEDARLLREKGIIVSRMKSDEEVARLWNGMSKSLRLTKVLYLDRVIEDVNVCYNRSWRVRFGKFMEVYLSRQVLTFVVVMFLFLMSMQVFSTAFNSTRRRPSTRS